MWYDTNEIAIVSMGQSSIQVCRFINCMTLKSNEIDIWLERTQAHTDGIWNDTDQTHLQRMHFQ